jgi:hypothetical protein
MAYNLGPVRAHVASAANTVGPKFGITVIYGWRAKDPYPDHPSGLALDFMTSSMATGSALAQYLIDNAEALGVDYIIWNRRSWNSKRRTWAPYSGAAHNDHVHATFFAAPGSGGLLNTTNMGLSNPLGAASETLRKLESVFGLVTDPVTWIRVSMFVGGILFIAIGIFGAASVKQTAMKVVKGAK